MFVPFNQNFTCSPINNNLMMPTLYSNFDFYNNMGMNNSMNMNMFNAMINYFNLYYSTMQNNMNNNGGGNNLMNRKTSSKMIPVYQSIQSNNNYNINNNNINNINNYNNNNNKPNLNQTVRLKKVTFMDIFPEKFEQKMNIFFQTPEGHKINVLVPVTAKMKDVLIKFVTKIGLTENDIDNTIIFIYSARKIKKNENRTLNEMGILNGSIIITMDKSGVLGA